MTIQTGTAMETGTLINVKGMTLNGYKLVLQDGRKELERVCPRCLKRKPLSAFGFRCFNRKKEIRLQAYCLQCRNSATT